VTHGVTGWQLEDWRQEETLHLISQVAERYKVGICSFGCLSRFTPWLISSDGRPRCPQESSATVGFSVLNEPSPTTPAGVLASFYREAYSRVRAHMPYKRVAVVFPVFPEGRWQDTMTALKPRSPVFENVILDLHLYQYYGGWWEGRSLDEHLTVPGREDFFRHAKTWIMVSGPTPS
jgi:hypothetical protein